MVVTLESLPIEILQLISGHLDYASTIAMRETCHDVHKRVTAPKDYTMADLLAIERWPEYDGASREVDDHFRQALAGRDFFACYLCKKIRSASQFGNAMMKSTRGKRPSPDKDQRHKRFCVNCAVEHNRWPKGQRVQFGGMSLSFEEGSGIVCCRCGRFGLDHPQSTYHAYIRNKKSCRDCLTEEDLWGPEKKWRFARVGGVVGEEDQSERRRWPFV